MLGPLERLIKAIERLPGIGKKSATRLAFHLIKTDQQFNLELAESVRTIKEKIRECSLCRNYTDVDPCPICSDPGRDSQLLCVVEQVQDLMSLNESGEFPGFFHVLHGVIAPLDGVGPDELKLPLLKRRVVDLGVKEIILATNPTLEGDTTALYIAKMMEGLDVKITRLASGLPVGGDIEYADKMTIARSLAARRPLDE
jgi:recombination protein RecR